MKKLLIVVVALSSLMACGGGDSTPTAPSQPAPPPAPTTANLSGRITETFPTASTAIAGATLTVADGANVGKTASTDGSGNYQFAGLTRQGFNVNVTAANYQSSGFGVDLTGDVTRNFSLTPAFQMISETLSGDISGSTAACGTRPCRTFALNMHHAGSITARLTWSNRDNDLDLEIWDGTTRIVDSAAASGTEEFVSTAISGARSFQLRVVYFSGSTIQPFQVAVTRPN